MFQVFDWNRLRILNFFGFNGAFYCVGGATSASCLTIAKRKTQLHICWNWIAVLIFPSFSNFDITATISLGMISLIDLEPNAGYAWSLKTLFLLMMVAGEFLRAFCTSQSLAIISNVFSFSLTFSVYMALTTSVGFNPFTTFSRTHSRLERAAASVTEG